MAHGLAEPDVVMVGPTAPVAVIAVVVLFIGIREGAAEFDAPFVVQLEAEIGEIVHGAEVVVVAVDGHGGLRSFTIDGDAAFTLAGHADLVVDDGLAAIDDGGCVKTAMAARFDVEDAVDAVLLRRLAGDDVDDAAERGAALQGDGAFHDFNAVDEIERDVVEHRGDAAGGGVVDIGISVDEQFGMIPTHSADGDGGVAGAGAVGIEADARLFDDDILDIRKFRLVKLLTNRSGPPLSVVTDWPSESARAFVRTPVTVMGGSSCVSASWASCAKVDDRKQRRVAGMVRMQSFFRFMLPSLRYAHKLWL